MAHLAHLDLSHNHLDATLHEALAEHAEALTPLRELVLRGNELGDAGVTHLARLPLMRQLRMLDLYHNEIGPDGVRALIDHHALVGLEVLDLSYNDIGDDGALALDHPSSSRLRRLVIGPKIPLEGLRTLQSSPHLEGCHIDFIEDKEEVAPG